MSDLMRLELRDPEAVLRADGRTEGGLTRAQLLRRAAAAGGAVLGGGVVLSGVPAAYAQGQTTDVDILNLLLLNEALEVAFYTEALARAGLTGRALAFVTQVQQNEIVHRDGAAALLGASARPLPGFAFGDATANQANVLATALALENNDVGVINGAGPLLVSRHVLGVAGQVVSVEARQAAWIRRIVYGPGYGGGPGQFPAPASFDAPITAAQAVAALRATGFVQGEI